MNAQARSPEVSRAIELMGCEPINPIGSCFDSTGAQALKWMFAKKQFKVCHGVGVATMPGQEGSEIKHAWLEAEGLAYDVIWGAACDIEKYRTDLKLNYVIEYDPDQFFVHWIRFDFPGPWDEKIKVAGRRPPK